jgi:predicted nucleic acid-binding protein
VIYLLDTSALKWAYIDQHKHCRRIRSLMSRCLGRVYIAEITVLEITNALGSMVRDHKLTVREFVEANRLFLRDVAAGRVIVVPFRNPDYVACRHLLTLVGIDSLKRLTSFDAMVAYSARNLAFEHEQVVTLFTSDKGLANVASQHSAFANLVEVIFLPRTP